VGSYIMYPDCRLCRGAYMGEQCRACMGRDASFALPQIEPDPRLAALEREAAQLRAELAERTRERDDWHARWEQDRAASARLLRESLELALDAEVERKEARALLALALEHGLAETERLREYAARCDQRVASWLREEAAWIAAEREHRALRDAARALLGALPRCAHAPSDDAADDCHAVGTHVVGEAHPTFAHYVCDAHVPPHNAPRELPHAAALRALRTLTEG
jgi:hypothetical protein